ncbi:MAG: hypothetical protein ACTSXV_02525 [Alphaproteobacteria bacterium]
MRSITSLLKKIKGKNMRYFKLFILSSAIILSAGLVAQSQASSTTEISQEELILKINESLNEQENCFDLSVIKCVEGYKISNDKKECIKDECSWKPNTKNVSEFEEKLANGCFGKFVTKCEEDFELIGEGKEIFCKEIIYDCTYKKSSTGVETWKSFKDKKENCMTEIPETCNSNYELKYSNTLKAECKKKYIRKGSTRN